MSGTSIVPSFPSDSQKNYNKIIAWVTGLLTLLLALFSFILSFTALTALAAEHGFSIPPLFPLVVEAGVIIFSLNALYRSLHGESAKWQWCLVIGSSLLAGAFNVLHARLDLVSRIMAAMPSLFLLLSFETFLGQIKHSITRARVVHTLAQLTDDVTAKQQHLEQLDGEVDQLNAAIVQAQTTLTQLRKEVGQLNRVQSSSIEHARQSKAVQDTVTIEQRRAMLVDILSSEGDIGASALSERLNIARGTVYNDLKALAKAGVIHKNSQGWKVVQ